MKQEHVARALGGGLCEAIQTAHGAGRGVRGPGHVLLLIGASPALVGWVTGRLAKDSFPMRPFVVCTSCDTPEMMPGTPTSQGLNGKGEPLFAPGTSGHALHVMTWVHDFEHRHVHATVNKAETVNV
jgi:hypothetical protein